MWKNVDSFLQADATLEMDITGSISAHELLIAVLAITFKAAYSDGSLGDFEVDRAVETIAHEFQKDPAEVRQQVEIADFLSRDSKKLSSLTENIRDHFNEAQKVEILKAVWKVLKADSTIQKSEALFAAELRRLLGLTMEQAVFAQN